LKVNKYIDGMEEEVLEQGMRGATAKFKRRRAQFICVRAVEDLYIDVGDIPFLYHKALPL